MKASGANGLRNLIEIGVYSQGKTTADSRSGGPGDLGVLDYGHSAAGGIGKDLGGRSRQRSAPYESKRLVNRALAGHAFKIPSLLENHALHDRSNELALARIQSKVEEHAARVGIFEGRTVAVKPGSKDHTASAGRRLGNNFIEILEQRRVADIGIRGHGMFG